MNAIILVVIGVVFVSLGYVFYSKFIAEKIYRLDPNYETPAYTKRDNVDYVPTDRVVLWGHHFTTVAGAATGSGVAGAAATGSGVFETTATGSAGAATGSAGAASTGAAFSVSQYHAYEKLNQISSTKNR